MKFLQLFESTDPNLLALLQEQSSSYTGALYHGAPISKLWEELNNNYFFSYINELNDYNLFSTTPRHYIAHHFFGGDENCVVEFEATNLQVVRLPDWIVGILSLDTGIDWYSDHLEEINELAPKYGIESYGEKYQLPQNWLSTNVRAEAYQMYEHAHGGNSEDEISVDWSIAGGKSLHINTIEINGEYFETPNDALKYIASLYSEEELKDASENW